MIPHQKTCCRVAKLAQIAELEIIERYLCVAFLFRIPQKSVHHHIVLSVGYFTRFLLQFETFFRNRSCCGVQHELRRVHDVGNLVSRFAGQVTSIASEEYHTCTPDFGHAPRVVRLDRPRKAEIVTATDSSSSGEAYAGFKKSAKKKLHILPLILSFKIGELPIPRYGTK